MFPPNLPFLGSPGVVVVVVIVVVVVVIVVVVVVVVEVVVGGLHSQLSPMEVTSALRMIVFLD